MDKFEETINFEKKVLELELKIEEHKAKAAALEAKRADLATKRINEALEKLKHIEAEAKELIARQPIIGELDRQQDYLELQMSLLKSEFNSWKKYLPTAFPVTKKDEANS
ncbi:hypothetical protein COLO4_36270 [Corchorus olitorius]|uniref:Uncharacterized protein n=1 Tax=Corchorus olitorius TaxID=93759 RepID=A0A1R3GA50_9ROSI|nr:hypothetical protein COLO4_36270 [Corchorus olitorius]